MKKREHTAETILPAPLADSAQAVSHSRRFLFTLIVCVAYEAFALTANGWGPLLAPLATPFSFSLDQAGLLFVCWSIGYLPGTLLGGPLLDTYGPKPVFFCAFLCILGGVGMICLAVTLHLAWLLGLVLCAGLTGVGGGVIDASANGFISRLYPQKRGAALNLFTALYPLSAMVIALVDAGFLLLFHNDPRPSLLFLFAVALVALFSTSFLPRTFQSKESHFHAPKRSSLFLSSFLTQGGASLSFLLPLSIAIIVTTGLTATIRTWTPAYLHLTYGQAPAFAALLSGVMNGLVLCFRLLVSLIVERIGTRSTLLLGLCVAASGLLVTLASHADVLMGTIALTVTAIGLTPLVATFLALGNERVAGQFSGSVSGLVLFLAGISNVIWSWLFGVILIRGGSLWAIAGCLVPLVCGILIVVRLQRDQKGNSLEKGSSS